MEKELWDAFYGKESKQERCSVLTESELNKHNKGMLKEGFMSDEDIHNQFSKFEVLDFSKEGEHSGYIELSFPNADEVDYDSSVITGYTIYEDGKVAFDNWFPDDVYNEVAEYVKQHHSEELDEGCGKKKKKALKESAESVYIYVDKPNRHNNNIIVKSDEFGKITYLPNDFEKLEDTIKRAVNDYAAENNIAEYEVIKLYESKKALKESDEDMSGYEDRLNKTIKSEMKKFPKYAVDAKKALDDGDEIKKILNKYNQEYNFLYNNHDKVAGYEEAVRAWDEYINHPDFRELIGKVIKARHDMFTSDREIGALMFALDALGYLDKFDGKESSLEPVVKEFKMNEGITTIDVNGKRYDIDTSMFVVDKHKGKWCVLDTKSNVRYYMDSKKEAEQKCRELNDPEEWKKWYLRKA